MKVTDVHRPGLEETGHVVGALLHRQRPVDRGDGDLGAGRAELAGHDVARLGGADQQHARTAADVRAQGLHQPLGAVFVGDDVGPQADPAERIGGLGADRGQPGARKGARVETGGGEPVAERRDAVGAREDEPGEASEVGERRVERRPVVRRGEPDRRERHHLGAVAFEERGEPADLGARARDHDPTPEQRAPLEPGQARPTLHTVADQQHRLARDAGGRGGVDQRAQRRLDRALGGGAGGDDERGGSRGRPAGREQAGDHRAQPPWRHRDRHRVVVQRDAGARGRRHGVAHPRHDLERETGVGQRGGLGPEVAGVARQQPDHVEAGARPRDEEGRDGAARDAPGIVRRGRDPDTLGVRRRQVEPCRRQAPVGDHHPGLAERPLSAQGEVTGIARTGADEADGSHRSDLGQARRPALEMIPGSLHRMRLTWPRCGQTLLSQRELPLTSSTGTG